MYCLVVTCELSDALFGKCGVVLDRHHSKQHVQQSIYSVLFGFGLSSTKPADRQTANIYPEPSLKQQLRDYRTVPVPCKTRVAQSTGVIVTCNSQSLLAWRSCGASMTSRSIYSFIRCGRVQCHSQRKEHRQYQIARTKNFKQSVLTVTILSVVILSVVIFVRFRRKP